MKIAVLGTGNVGATLGRRWAESGHEVAFGTRDPSGARIAALVASAPGARAATHPEAVEDADVVVLATPWPAAQATVEPLDLAGRILVDCTNPIAEGLAGLELGTTTSAAEQVAGWSPGASVVKAFNTTGSANMADPAFGERAAAMFVAGDDEDDRGVVAGLAEELGFKVCDCGPLRTARYLEALAMLWVDLAVLQHKGADFAFAVLTR